jgi:hypothetical protein
MEREVGVLTGLWQRKFEVVNCVITDQYSQGKEFWDALDPDNTKQVLEVVKEEVRLNVRLAIQDLISAQN